MYFKIHVSYGVGLTADTDLSSWVNLVIWYKGIVGNGRSTQCGLGDLLDFGQVF